MTLTSLSIVLPCYDEAANVSRAIREAGAAAARFANRYEIVVVAKDGAPGGYLERTWWTIGPGEAQDWGDVRATKIGGN